MKTLQNNICPVVISGTFPFEFVEFENPDHRAIQGHHADDRLPTTVDLAKQPGLLRRLHALLH